MCHISQNYVRRMHNRDAFTQKKKNIKHKKHMFCFHMEKTVNENVIKLEIFWTFCVKFVTSTRFSVRIEQKNN